MTFQHCHIQAAYYLRAAEAALNEDDEDHAMALAQLAIAYATLATAIKPGR